MFTKMYPSMYNISLLLKHLEIFSGKMAQCMRRYLPSNIRSGVYSPRTHKKLDVVVHIYNLNMPPSKMGSSRRILGNQKSSYPIMHSGEQGKI